MIPLSEKLRPKTLSQIKGQDSLVGPDGYITKIIKSKKPLSLLLFGPPGCGKTTLARLYAQQFQLPFVTLSGVLNTTADLKKIIKKDEPLFVQTVLVFVDEIHRFNRAQQDIFLPLIEDGTLVLIGATTENPSFALNNALLSRLRVIKMECLSIAALEEIVQNYESLEGPLHLSQEARRALLNQAQGDGRHLINLIENLRNDLPTDKKSPLYDRDQEYHYNLISALHKSIRGSDPDAALYWFARMLSGGEDPLFIGRRLIRMASEDIGLADPQALSIAISGWNAYHMLGSPEGELSLAQVVIYLALAPKSNALYVAYGEAKTKAEETGHLNPPNHILNAPTQLMKTWGYGSDYQYDPDTEHGFSGQEYFPESCGHCTFYKPVERGFEREMKKRIDYFIKLRAHLLNK